MAMQGLVGAQIDPRLNITAGLHRWRGRRCGRHLARGLGGGLAFTAAAITEKHVQIGVKRGEATGKRVICGLTRAVSGGHAALPELAAPRIRQNGIGLIDQFEPFFSDRIVTVEIGMRKARLSVAVSAPGSSPSTAQ
jgi:hypothetical protein